MHLTGWFKRSDNCNVYAWALQQIGGRHTGLVTGHCTKSVSVSENVLHPCIFEWADVIGHCPARKLINHLWPVIAKSLSWVEKFVYARSSSPLVLYTPSHCPPGLYKLTCEFIILIPGRTDYPSNGFFSYHRRLGLSVFLLSFIFRLLSNSQR